MQDINIADTFRIRNRFLRSANLEKDFYDLSALNGYVVSPQIRSNLIRLLDGLAPDSSQRAWRITGDYGSGKSTFALALAHLFSGRHEYLPKQLKNAADSLKFEILNPHLLPVLVTGSREPLGNSIIRALMNSLKNLKDQQNYSQIMLQVEDSAKGSYFPIPEAELINLLNIVNSYVCDTKTANGILIIIDELGKFLEFAAMHPDSQDVYLLQTLAEMSARSGKNPIFIVGILHQGFTAYANDLSVVSQREWEKVAERYEEILFNQPLEQKSTIIAEALNIKEKSVPEIIIKELEVDTESALKLGWYGVRNDNKSLIANARRLYPLHPTVLPVLNSLFTRFGQNERSLFSFLLSNEPFGLMEFSQKPVASNSVYRIHNLYDYTHANFGNKLNIQGYRSHWSQIESIVENFVPENEYELQILKTVAMLNLLDINNLIATDSTLELSINGPNSAKKNDIANSITRLRCKHILYNRGIAGGYCLWPHTSVNLEKHYNEAINNVSLPKSIVPFIQSDLRDASHSCKTALHRDG